MMNYPFSLTFLFLYSALQPLYICQFYTCVMRLQLSSYLAYEISGKAGIEPGFPVCKPDALPCFKYPQFYER